MTDQEILARLGLALAIGLLIGVERGWREREQAEGERTAGLRTFALIGLSGAIWGLLTDLLGPVPLAAAFIAFAGGVTLFKWRESEHDGNYGATTLVAALLTFALGVYAVLGSMVVAAAAGVAMAALLAAKRWLHAWIEAMTWEELRATLILLVMSFVALPVLPDRDFGPYGALNLHALWLMTIAIAGVSFIGYVAVKLIGAKYGTLVAGVAGGLVSSTAATLDAARRASADPAQVHIQLAGAFAASSIMFLRVVVIVALFGADKLPRVAVPLVVAALVLLVASIAFGARWEPAEKGEDGHVFRNPFELFAVLRFAALLAVILVASKWLVALFGGAGAVVFAGVAGLADVDAITLSMTQAGGGGISAAEAAVAIFVATVANSLSKSVIATVAGGPGFGLRYAAVTVAALLAGGAAMLVQSWPW
jgi:uncharacterized membrane protein (DUF4010 family)